MNWVTQSGWVLIFSDYEEHAILGVMVSAVGAVAVIPRLKDQAKHHRHPRGGRNQLKWTLNGAGWEAVGRYGGQFYVIEPHTVEVLS